MEFKKDGKSIILNKKETEPNDVFTGRGWFIASQHINELNSDYDEVVKYSKIWSNIKFKNIKYNTTLTQKSNNMEKQLKRKFAS